MARDIPGKYLHGKDRDAYQALLHLFRSYGLGSLAPNIRNYLQNGYAPDTITVLLRDTPEYKRRFKANEARKAKGLPVLSPAEYLATERSYRQVMRAAGLPHGFYNQQKDFEKFLENDVSPTELQGRVQAAEQMVDNADKDTLAFFRQHYTKGDLVAYALNPKRAAPLIEKRFQAAEIGGAAAGQGLSIGRRQAESLASLGVDEAAASQGFSAIAAEDDTANFLADISDEEGFTTADLIDETFRADNAVTKRRQSLAARERGRFSGSSGLGQGSLSANNDNL